ncbi:phosphoinositide phosphatase SAC1 [Chlorella sorokiniana]|uniref:Phosphoinositide phosphatase SAC1 n=1 Tax=Chlorella sorokiniana TaxID=3076 RepID=A0A2P6TWF9_CHLSO|nr:phosphoinositide phosphatase SAC1 [Chlorella sorokiniana]|eukprot:PRW58397.1 phosphoinositide phosphatase SAC1 [Chlorella sorokiniana]
MVSFTLYQTPQRLFIVRHSREGGEEHWRVLRVDRTSSEFAATEDPTCCYTKPQLQRLLATLHAGNQRHGGLQLVCEAHAIIGCVQFLEGPYLLLCTKRRFLGAICGHKVYGIDATALLPVLCPVAHRQLFGSAQPSTAEVRYRKLLAGVQLSRDFFFSYSWPVHQTAQRTFGQVPEQWWTGGISSNAAEGCGGAFGSHRVWNEFLSRPLREALAESGSGGAGSSSGDCHRWVVPLAHGFFEQRPLALLGRTLTLTLVARRSRQFAGTRYLKRGVTDRGFVANDVEIEQIVEAGVDWKTGQPLLSSVVQVRGSIPLHWAQRPDSSMLKPEIVLHRFDPLYAATRRHFELLREQYGDPVCVLDLVKRVERRPRESVLGQEFAAAVRYLNQRLPPGQDAQRVQYSAFDLSHKAKTAKKQLLTDLQRLQEPVLHATGIFVSAGRHGGAAGAPAGPAREQHGVLRTNCIDSLDRTNVAQFTYGMLALGQQLHALGIAESAWLDPGSSLARHLMDSYEQMGHTLALQYGGSEAHATFFQRQRGDWEAATQSRDLLTSVRRFYSGMYTDAEKQDALNVFLGSFRPQAGKPHVWELGSDAYLHTGAGRTPARASSMGSRTASFSAAIAAQQAGPSTPAATAAAVAAAATAAVGGGEQLASFPPPASPPPPPRQGIRARLGSPREGRPSDSPELVESLSAASLVSLASDGSFAPPLHALVDGASSQPPPDLVAMQEEAAAEAVTPRASTQQAAVAAAVAAMAEAAAPAATAGAAQPSTSRAAAAAAPGRAGPRRSPLMAGTRKAAKLESLDKILGRQPVAHVRLSSAPQPPKPTSALGWLSPSKSAQAPANKRAAESAADAKAAAAAKATVAVAGVAAAGPGVPIPGAGLRRSNSDPSLSSSLTPAANLAAAMPPAAGAGGLPPRPRRVTFDSAGSGLGAQAALAPTGGGLVRQSTAPTSSLDQWGSAGGLSAAGSSGGLSTAPSGSYGQVQPGRLLVMETRELGSGGLPAMLRPGGTSYHALAGLNLEGAAAAEASIRPGPAPAAADPLPKPPQRRLSFPNFALLRAFGRKASGHSGAASPGGMAVGRSITEPGPSGSDGMQPAPSLLGPRLLSHGSGGLGAPEPLSMSAVVYGAEAVRRGVDTLGVAAPPSASWWLTGADPLAAMMAEAQQLRAQVLRQREALATLLDPVEHRALLEQCAAAMRPTWTLDMGAFAQGSSRASQQPQPAAPGSLGAPAAAAAPAVPPHGLAF